MPNLEDRPYTGGWSPNNRPVVKHTPDAMVFINGDVAIPGCPRCNGRIDIQKFVTQLSVEAGTNPGAHSASITLNVPRNYGEQMFGEGRSKLRPALEVHIYVRGYFPVQGQFAHLPNMELELGGNAVNLDNFPTYPYYHVFHGVVTSVNYEYSDGFYSASVTCASLLHFWQYHNMTMSGSYLGSKPSGSKVRPNKWGNAFNNMNPYSIIYQLYRDVAGAAGGIEFALRNKTNVDAVNRVAGKQNFSLLVEYWEERFKTSLQQLRMYGVNGRLYNGLQQAYLTRRNKSKVPGDGPGGRAYLDPATVYNVKDFSSSQRELAKALGLEGEGLDVTFGPRPGQGVRGGGGAVSNTVDFNITSIAAFSQSLNDMGNFSLMESTYQTKLDIANTVMQATGFEFYQDVDGDLVFKPPFYNLDTRPSRIYRIEDIDIISISFQEKEPEVTYVVMKAGHFKNLRDTGTEGFVGNRAMYADYRLIAQYGWRPANEEVTYVTSPKSLFFLAQARMDLLNVDIHSCQVTLPIRPEMRPGYPVYIPFIDCFYYVTALSHQFGFGAQCTTSLTLTARRAKFHAPGEIGPVTPGDNAINRVRLDRPDLPERPLWVYDNGIPRVVGFPNVVMALDSDKSNPKFFLVGAGLENLNSIDDVELLFNTIREQIKTAGEGAGVFGVADPLDEESVPTEHTKYRLKVDSNPENDLIFSLSDLIGDFQSLQDAADELATVNKQIAKKSSQLQNARPKKRASLQAEIATLEAEQSALQDLNVEGDQSKVKLVQLINALQSNDVIRGLVPGIPSAGETSSYLEVLNDVKSSWELSLPGYYRYYSCSHPDTNQQGQSILVFDQGSGSDEKEAAAAQINAAPAPIELSAPSTGVFKGTTDVDLTSRKARRAARKSKTREQNRADLRVKTDLLESVSGVQGISVFCFAAASSETALTFSNFAANDTKRERGFSTRTWLGQEVPRGQQTTATYTKPNGGTSPDSQFFKKFGRAPNPGEGVSKYPRHLGNPHLFDSRGNVLPGAEKRWAFGSGGYYGMFPSTGLGAFRGSSKYRDLPPESIFDPTISQAMQFNYLATKCRNHTRETNRPLTWGQLRRSMGGGLGGAARDTPFGSKSVDRKFIRGLTRAGLSEEEAMEFWGTPVPCEQMLDPSNGVLGNRDALLDKLLGGRTVEKSFKQQKPAKPIKVEAKVEPPSITKEPQPLERPMPVLGFLPGPLETPEGTTRPPEAELGEIEAVYGLKIAQPKKQPARVVATNKIQQIQFSEYQRKTKVDVIGFAKESGSYAPNQIKSFLVKELRRRFKEAADNEGIDQSKTPRDLFGEEYDRIRDLLNQGAGSTSNDELGDANGVQVNTSSRAYPIYRRIPSGTKPNPRDEFEIEDLATILLQPMTTGVGPIYTEAQLGFDGNGVELGVPDANGQITLQITRSVADEALVSLAVVRRAVVKEVTEDGVPRTLITPGSYRYSGKKGSGAKVVLDKVINDYATEMTNVVVNAYDQARRSAGWSRGKKPAGFGERMSDINDAFQQILFDMTQVPFSIKKGKKKDKTGKSAKNDGPLYIPVFPVSDQGGYEHFGAFRYGRGLSVDPGGSFDRINQDSDPLSGLSAASSEALLNVLAALLSSDKRAKESRRVGRLKAALEAEVSMITQEQVALENERQETGLIDPFARRLNEEQVQRAAEIRIVLSELERSRPDAVRELEEAFGFSENSLKLTENQDIVANKLSNFPAGVLTEGPMKTTVINAAFNLADLAPHLTDQVNTSCVCNLYSSSTLLAAASQINFTPVEGIDPIEDPAFAQLSQDAIDSLSDYQFQRQALQGQALDSRGPDLADSFNKLKDIKNLFTDTGRQLREQGEEFKRTAEQIGDINLGPGGSDD